MSIKKYRVVAKTGNDTFMKWKVNDLVKFTDFLDKKHSGWRWFNVFRYQKDGKGEQIANFTKKNKPSNRYVSI